MFRALRRAWFRVAFLRRLVHEGGPTAPGFDQGGHVTGATVLAKHKFAINDREFDVEVGARRSGHVQVSVNGTTYDVELKSAAPSSVIMMPRSPSTVSARPPPSAAGQTSSAADSSVRAPMAGLVLSIFVKVGDQVQPGDELLSLEAMKMENAITAERFGTISRIAVEPNQVVNQGDALIEFE